MDPHEATLLKKLEGVLEGQSVRMVIDDAIAEAKGQLDTDPQRQTGTVQVSLSVWGPDLPADIKSCRVFVFRAGNEFNIERHPNSCQRVLSLAGTGKIRVFENPTPGEVFLGSDKRGPLEIRWATLPANIWHQPVSDNEDWVVLTFHTASEKELIDEYRD